MSVSFRLSGSDWSAITGSGDRIQLGALLLPRAVKQATGYVMDDE